MIRFDEKTKVFHLKNEKVSYVIGVLENGQLGHYYFGKPLTGALMPSYFRADQNRGLTAYLKEGDMAFSLNLERQVYPSFGRTDFRTPAIDITLSTGSRILDFKYHSHEIIAGKPKLNGLPSTWSDHASDAQTLIIKLADDVIQAELELKFTIFKNYGVLARSAEITNYSNEKMRINRMMSFSFDFMDNNYTWMQYSGDWVRERHLVESSLRRGTQSIGSLRGASGSEHNPFVILRRDDTREDSGEALAGTLVYSGNFLIEAQSNSDEQLRFQAGIHPDHFTWVLERGKSFSTPEGLIAYSGAGLGGLSRTLHDFYRNHLIAKRWQEKERPVLVNNWEATYFDFDEVKLLELAKEAKLLGIELFVLDDGWFGNRNDDTSSLGDWTANLNKLPGGVKRLSERINDMGLSFGIWIEPEMISKNSELYKAHPDWVIHDPLRSASHARNQYVLDYSRVEVVDHIYNQIIKMLDDSKVSYIKWDMNRNITEAYSAALTPEHQDELYHRYILGVYDLYERLTRRYPEIIFESCAAGGGRFDLGMLYYAPQAWTSDNTDAIERLKIQYGTSMGYPLSSMGSHVSASPNHQVLRKTSLKMRADVAYFGTFGYELDLTKLTELEKETIGAQIKFFKKHRSLIHHGDFYRLKSPFEGDRNQTAWMVVNKDKTEALVAWYQVLAQPNEKSSVLPLKGLCEDCEYTITGYENPVDASILMNFGLYLQPAFNGITKRNESVGDFQSRIWYMRKTIRD